MTKKNIYITFIPSIIIILISILSFTNILSFSELDLKGVSLLNIVLSVPLIFLIQGVLCKINNTKIMLPLLVSIITSFVLIIIFLNSSALGYLLYYLIAYTVGYLSTKVIINLKNK